MRSLPSHEAAACVSEAVVFGCDGGPIRDGWARHVLVRSAQVTSTPKVGCGPAQSPGLHHVDHGGTHRLAQNLLGPAEGAKIALKGRCHLHLARLFHLGPLHQQRPFSSLFLVPPVRLQPSHDVMRITARAVACALSSRRQPGVLARPAPVLCWGQRHGESALGNLHARGVCARARLHSWRWRTRRWHHGQPCLGWSSSRAPRPRPLAAARLPDAQHRRGPASSPARFSRHSAFPPPQAERSSATSSLRFSQRAMVR